VGANLIELEEAPTRSVLDAAALDGQTAARWTEGRAALARLFTWYAALGSVMDAAVAARGARPTLPASKTSVLTGLLLGPSIALSEDPIELADRDLLSRSRVLVRVTPDELLLRMADDYREVRDVVVQAAQAWDDVLPRVQDARARADATAELLDERELDAKRQVDGWIAELDDLCRWLCTDPLSIAVAPLERIEHDLSRLANDRAALEELRRRWPATGAAAHARLEQLERLFTATALQHRETAEKVVRAAGAPAPIDALADGLTRIDRAARDGRWTMVSSELDRWHQAVEAVTTRLMQEAAADRACLDARRQLRGLLDAYVAKASTLGRLEDAALGPSLAALQDELYRAPTDLDHATELLNQVQAALSAPRKAMRA
jgi:hypothetical protein